MERIPISPEPPLEVESKPVEQSMEAAESRGSQNDSVQDRAMVASYKEMGEQREGKTSANTWGFLQWEGKDTNVYGDTRLITESFVKEILATNPIGTIRIADFGGAEGTVMREIFKQLREAGVAPIGATIDAALKMEGGKTAVAWKEYRDTNLSSRDRVVAMPANYMKEDELELINIHSNSLDFVYSRYSTQYVGEENRPEFFARQVEYLKPGGRLVATWPGASDERTSHMLNAFWAGYQNILQGIRPEEYARRQHYPTPEQVSQAAKVAGLEIISCENFEAMALYLNEEALSNGSRFSALSDGQRKRLRELYVQLRQDYGDLVQYDEEADKYCAFMSIGKLVARKPLVSIPASAIEAGSN